MAVVFDKNADGTTLSYDVAYYSSAGWNVPYVVAWCELPPFPQAYVNANKKLLEQRENVVKPVYETRCRIE